MIVVLEMADNNTKFQQTYMIVLEMADNLSISVLLVLRVFRAP